MPQQHNAGIIYASISGFGTEQGASLPGYDLIVQAMSGLMSLTGDSDGPAYRSGISVFDVMAMLHATIGILAALNHHNHTGEGQHCAVWPCSRVLRGYSVTSLKSCAPLSHPTSTLRSIGTPCTGQPSATTS